MPVQAAWAAELPRLFSDNMVLQRDRPIVVWGQAAPGEEVEVTLPPDAVFARAGTDGAWQATLPARGAGGPYMLTVAGAGATTVVANLAVGEVWLCSGQSNMEMVLASAGDAAAQIADSDEPELRLLTIAHAARLAPERAPVIMGGGWKVSGPGTARDFSAVCFIMGRALHRRLQLPVGLINASSGGSAAEAWISAEALAPMADFRDDLARLRAGGPVAEADPTLLWNGMVYPLRRFPLRGVAWYQGEANDAHPERYGPLLSALIDDWRRQFGSGLPFAIVQLPNAGRRRKEPIEQSAWPLIREAQAFAARDVAGVALTVTIDTALVGAPNPRVADLHPRNKADVGNRLARAILGSVYGYHEPRSPQFARVVAERRALRVFFADLAPGERMMAGIKTGVDPVRPNPSGTLTGFAVAGVDEKWVKARAIVDGATVIVSARSVPAPVAVRYAWGDNPAANLYTTSGLPAAPFRSDLGAGRR